MLYQQLQRLWNISVEQAWSVQQMMDSSPSIGNPKLLVLNPVRILARHHVDIMPNHQKIVTRCACFRRPNTGDSADALSKNHNSWCSQKNGLHHLNRWPQHSKACNGDFDAISRWKVRKHDRFRNNKKSLRRFGAGLKAASILRSVSWKTPTFLHLLMWVKQWDDL